MSLFPLRKSVRWSVFIGDTAYCEYLYWRHGLLGVPLLATRPTVSTFIDDTAYWYSSLAL
eukprot:903677-Alexandrium_andersonii.AAC.1